MRNNGERAPSWGLRNSRTRNHAAAIHNHSQDSVQPFVKPLVLSFSTSRHGEPVTIGNFIKRARLAKGLKQAEVARMMGVDEMTVVNWKRYKTVPMRNRSMIQRICQTLSLDYAATESKFESVGNLSA